MLTDSAGGGGTGAGGEEAAPVCEINLQWSVVDNTNFQTQSGLASIASDGSKFIAVGSFGRVLTSTDGDNWSDITDSVWGQDNRHALNSIQHNGSMWVAGGANDTILTSTDGLTWSVTTLSRSIATFNPSILNVTYGNGKWVASGNNTLVFTSNDGITWSDQRLLVTKNFDGQNLSNPQVVQLMQPKVKYEPAMNQFMYADGRYAWFSSDGEQWEQEPIGPTTHSVFGFNALNAIGSDGTRWIAIERHPSQNLSVFDMTSKTEIAQLENPWDGSHTAIHDLIHVDGTWLGVGWLGQIYTSEDAVNWEKTVQASMSQWSLNGVAFNGSKFVAVGSSNNGNHAQIRLGENDCSE